MTRAHTPSIPPVIEADEAEYRDSGVPSTIAIFGHPLHPLLVTFPIADLLYRPIEFLGLVCALH